MIYNTTLLLNVKSANNIKETDELTGHVTSNIGSYMTTFMSLIN